MRVVPRTDTYRLAARLAAYSSQPRRSPRCPSTLQVRTSVPSFKPSHTTVVHSPARPKTCPSIHTPVAVISSTTTTSLARTAYPIRSACPCRTINWHTEFGGALELYPVREGETVPEPDVASVKTIPPTWNQFVFFEVQPGKR